MILILGTVNLIMVRTSMLLARIASRSWLYYFLSQNYELSREWSSRQIVGCQKMPYRYYHQKSPCACFCCVPSSSAFLLEQCRNADFTAQTTICIIRVVEVSDDSIYHESLAAKPSVPKKFRSKFVRQHERYSTKKCPWQFLGNLLRLVFQPGTHGVDKLLDL